MEGGATAARVAALEVLERVRGGELADRALTQSTEGLDPREHAWVQELVYGTLRLRGRLDHVLEGYVKGGLGALDPEVLDVLRLGAYQLFEMGSVPEYAAVSQSVELVRSAGAPRAAGLVNGVLQAVRRGGKGVDFPRYDADPVGHLASWGSHPRWLVERWVERWGAAAARGLIEANNERPDLYLSPVGMSAGEALERLAGAGIDAEGVRGFPDSVRVLPGTPPVAALGAIPAVVQDPAAAMVARYAAFPPGAVAYDLCAAPGGKTSRLADVAAYVVAADLSVGRLRRVRANVRRVGVDARVGLVVADGRQPPFRPGHAVLIDAPCAGTGTLRRHPDGRWRITPRDIEALSALQRELLAAAAGITAAGGIIVYSTCSLEPEENEHQVEWFLREQSGFRLEPSPAAGVDPAMLHDGCLSLLPHRHGVDGAFAARLVRVN